MYECFMFFFFNDTATTEIYTLSLHDALPIYALEKRAQQPQRERQAERGVREDQPGARVGELEGAHQHIERDDHHDRREHRSEEHTSELQSRLHLVCRLLLEKKKKKKQQRAI